MNGRRAQSGGGRGGSRSDLQLALHCTATEERWKVQVHTILYHTITTKQRDWPEWDGPSSDGGRGELEGGITRGIYGRERERAKERFW